MIAWLMGFGLSRRGATIALVAFAAILLLVAFYIALDAYGDARYKAGKADEEKAWQEASNKLIQRAQNAANEADQAAASRQADYSAKLEDEKERIDAAQQNGSSPFDVLFNSSDTNRL